MIMRHTILIVSTAALLSACGNSSQNKAIEDQKKAQKVIEASEGAPIPTKEGEWTMTAKIDGKEWVASSFRSPDATDWINGDYKEESIKLPYYRKYMIVGHKIAFRDTHTAQLFTSDEVGIWSGEKGEMEITKVDGQWVEGKFFFTATANGTDKTIEVTDGFFRISLSGK